MYSATENHTTKQPFLQVTWYNYCWMVNSEMGYKYILLNVTTSAYSFHSEHTFHFFPLGIVTLSEPRNSAEPDVHSSGTAAVELTGWAWLESTETQGKHLPRTEALQSFTMQASTSEVP